MTLAQLGPAGSTVSVWIEPCGPGLCVRVPALLVAPAAASSSVSTVLEGLQCLVKAFANTLHLLDKSVVHCCDVGNGLGKAVEYFQFHGSGQGKVVEGLLQLLCNFLAHVGFNFLPGWGCRGFHDIVCEEAAAGSP